MTKGVEVAAMNDDEFTRRERKDQLELKKNAILLVMIINGRRKIVWDNVNCGVLYNYNI